MQSLDFTVIDIIGFILGIFSIFIGIKYPDWDFKFKLKHRSILTHSPIILFIFIYFYLEKQKGVFHFLSGEKEIGFRYFIIGFAIGMGIHFLYDLFPKGWKGSALLHLPILNKKVRKNGSIFLFIIFTIISFSVAIKLCRTLEEVFLFFLFGLLLLWLNKRKEGKLIRPTVSYLIMFGCLGSYFNEEFYSLIVERIGALIAVIS